MRVRGIEHAMSPTPAGWYPDPERRHEYRYYDGSLWTEHVADQGQIGSAPIRGSMVQTRDDFPRHAALGGLRPGTWLPQVPRFKMWGLALLSPFLFWITVNGHRLILPIGIPCALWCWYTTTDVLAEHRRANSSAVAEIRAARYLALALAAFGFIQFALWTN
jgi:hypothetical protein